MLEDHNKKHKTHLINLIRRRSIETPNFALLIGAGASASSGVKIAKEMIEEWRRQLFEQSKSKDPFDEWLKKQDWYEDDEEYSILFERVYDQRSSRRVYIEECVKDARPSWGYIYLANIIAHKYFNVIFTPNFDDLLNEACFLYADLRPIVSAHDSAVADIRVTSARPKIIKLHGDFLYENIKNTLRETERLEDNMRAKFVQFAREYGLVVIGYGGNDRSIMDILDTLLQSEGYFPNGLYWCVRSGDTPSKKLQRLMKRDDAYWVELDGFDEFMAELHQGLTLRLPLAVRDPYKATTERLNRFILPKEGVKHDIIKTDIAELERQVKTLEQITSGEIPAENFDRLVPYRFLGDGEDAAHNYAKALIYFDKALKQNPDDTDLIRKMVYAHLALDQTEKALSLSERLIRLIPNSYIGYWVKGSVVARTAPNEAIAVLTEALKHAEKPSERAILLTSRSNVYLITGKWEEALSDAQESLQILPRPATTINKCIALKRLGRESEAISLLKEILASLEHKYLRAGAFAQLGDKGNMLKELEAAIKEDRSRGVSAKYDPDFADYREDPDFRALIYGTKV
jgi:NAD-dependent SIR2 family protein deacetylase